MLQKLSIVLFLAIIAGNSCENEYQFSECTKSVEGSEDLVPDHSNCNVTAVRLSPCSAYPCKIKRGKTITIEFDFVPEVTVDTIENDVVWASPEGDLPWQGLIKNGCDYTQCPLTKDVKQTYKYDVKITKSVPGRLYDVKWGIAHEDKLKCCALVSINIKS